MGEAFDTVRLFSEVTELVDHLAVGESGLDGLRRVTDMGLWTLGATGVAFVEFGPVSGRIVAASGHAVAALGRSVGTGGPLMAALISAERTGVRTRNDLPAELHDVAPADEMLVGRVTRGERVVGVLIGYLPPDGPVDARRQAAFRYLTAEAGRIYLESRGLPLHADPAIRAAADASLIIGADGLVAWVNARSRDVLDIVGVAVGAPMPLPMPGPGQVVEHDTADGRWLRLTARRLPDAEGIAVTVRDVSEARRWDQSRELFVALTSHELRTPVTVIKGYADTLTDRWESLDERGRLHAARVLGQRAGELARLLDRLLSAVGEPGVPPVVSRFDLGEALRGAVAALPEELRARVRFDLAGSLPPVFGEEASIASVVSELVTNAGKYVTDPASEIDIEGISDARTVGFRICDHGIGVRPEHVESAFERFWQADTGDHRRYGGVGLGLYLVRRIVERQNGWVSLRPRESGGTVAEVRLPRGDVNPVRQQSGEA